MIKSEIISLLANKYKQLPETEVADNFNVILEHMVESLCRKRRIELRGFGSFSLHLRKARKAHNPKTGENVQTHAKYTPHFKPGKALRERVNTSKFSTPLKREEGESS